MSYVIGPRSIVGTVRQSLHAVTGFSIVKELLQNADDCGARRWALGSHQGIPKARHPLLTGPAMFVVNDGPFRPVDAEAICQVHISGKAGDTGSIGKFGLGLKSLYRHCEAFLYFANDGSAGGAADLAAGFSERFPPHGVLSPWLLRNDHPDNRLEWQWPAPPQTLVGHERADPDLVLLREAVASAVGWRGFTLWIPLRLERHTELADGRRAHIHAETFDETGVPRDIFNGRLEQDLRRVAPLLRSIRMFQVLGPDEEHSFALDVTGSDGPVSRTMPVPRAKPELSVTDDPVRFGGQIRSPSASSWYAGVERGVTRMLSLRSAKHWPSTMEQTDLDQRQVPDKTVPHAAVVIVATPQPTGTGHLDIGRAVFLPVSERQDERVPLRVAFDVHVTLHGYYFLSPDRTSIRMPPNGVPASITSETDLMEAWNARLDAEATYPLLLDALKAFAVETRRADPDAARSGSIAEAVTRAVQASRLFEANRNAICAERAWVRTWEANGRRTWRLLEPDASVVSCPDPRALFRLAPTAGAVLASANASLMEATDPYLMPSTPIVAWDTPLLDAVVRAIDVERAATDEGMADLVTFLKPQIAKEPTRAALASVCVPLFRSLVGRAVPRADLDLPESLLALLALLPTDRRFAIPRRTQKAVWDVLHSLDIDLVIHPDAKDLASNPRLAMGAARGLLNACASGRDTDELVMRILTACEEPVRVTASAPDLEVLPARLGGHATPISFTQLRTAADEGWLLDRDENQYTFVPQLQACLEGIELVQVSAALAQLLGLTPPMGTLPTVLSLLGRRPPLTDDPRPRVALVQAIQSSGTARSDDDIARYLLHGNVEHCGDPSLLYYQGPGDAFAASILPKVLVPHGAGWRWIAFGSLLDEKIPLQQLRSIGVRAASNEVLHEFLTSAPTPKLLPRLEDAEYDHLLRTVEDVELARSLPIHETIEGRREPLHEGSVLESDFLLGFHGNSELFEGLQQIRVHLTLSESQTRLGLRPLDPTTVLARVMSRPVPMRYWREAMGVLPQSDIALGELRARVLQRPWLPTSKGPGVAPMHVFRFPDLDGLVTPDLLDTGTPVVHFDSLSEELRSHLNVGDLFSLIPTGSTAIELLGEALAPRAEYRVGEVDQLAAIANDTDVGAKAITAVDWRVAFGPTADAAPLTKVLHLLDPASADILWRRLLCPIDAGRCRQHLEVLRERHRSERMRSRRDAIQAVHDTYLALAHATPPWSIGDPTLELLARSGEWRPPSKLTYGEAGVDPSFVVCDIHARILGVEGQGGQQLSATDRHHVLPQTEAAWQGVDRHLQSTADALETYFEAWAGRVKPELIGGLLSLLGDDHRIRGLADRYLGRFSVDEVRNGLEVPIAASDVLRDEPNTLSEKIHANRFLITIERGTTLAVPNLLGDPIEVQATTDPDTLLAGRREHVRRESVYYVGLRLLPAGSSDTIKLRQLIRETARMCLKSVYNRPDTRLDELLDTLDQSEQLDVAVVQDRCIAAAEHYLRGQLGARSRELDPYIAAITAARVAQSERRVITGGERHEEAQRAETEALHAFRDAIERDDRLHAPLLAAVRRKVEQYQYRPASIPFELLQNADDALGERLRLDPDAPLDAKFVVARFNGGFDIMHWGRQINRGERPLDHHRDLEKMLTLSASDKGSESVGKFGLGFKSVFLIADRPAVLSQDLGFSVVGGFYPTRLDPTTTAALRSRLEQFGGRSGTLIRLEAHATAVNEALERFERLAPYLPLFTRNVRRIDLLHEGKEARYIEASLAPTHVPDLSVADLPGTASRVAIFGTRDFGIAVRFNADGFGEFADDVPRVWVTTPTSEQARFAFLMFGCLDLDVGRQNLAAASRDNLRRARTLASSLRGTIEHLHALSSTERAELFGSFAADSAKFWGSLFDVLSTNVATEGVQTDREAWSANQLAWAALWGSDGALRRAVAEYPIVPTLLPNPYDKPTRAGAIAFVARRPLDEHTVFTGPAATTAFSAEHPVGTVVAACVANRLRELGCPIETNDLSLSDALRAAVGPDGLMTPDLAAHLGAWWRGLTDSQRRDVTEDADESPWASLVFKSNTGAYRPPSVMVGPEDVADVLAFAPEDATLAADYSGPGVELFAAAREVDALRPEVVATWVLAQESEVGRSAAIRFLLRHTGILSWRVRMALQDRAGGTWLSDAKAVPSTHAHDHFRLQALLGLPLTFADFETDDAPLETPLPSPGRRFTDPAAMLRWVAERWAAEHEGRIEQYERATFPWGLDHLAGFGADNLASRRSWLTLLLLGAFHTLGRQRPEQHRAFLRICHERGWFDEFATIGGPHVDADERSIRWLCVIDEFLDPEQIATDDQYRHWMGQFVNVYQLSTWLDSYVHLLRNLDACHNQAEIQQVWTPASASVLSGSGITAPPLDRVLRIGKHFVVRELLRRGILKGPLLDEFAFVPTRRLRTLWQTHFIPLPDDPTDASRTVHRELRAALGTEGARFGGAYDLAFDVLFDEEGA